MISNSPIVSVIIPTYNRAKLLERAVNSVLRQTYKELELIIVNDSSKDETEKAIKKYADDRIKYICHQKNLGGSAARNTGIKAAQGKYIALLDDDDGWFPEKLEKQVKHFAEVSDNVGLVYSGFEVIDMNGIVIQKTYPKFKGNLYMRLLERSMIGGSSVPLIKRTCFKKVGLFDQSLRSCQDWDMWMRISEHYAFDFIPEILTKMYSHSHQLSSDYSSMIPGRTRMIEKHMKVFQKHPAILVIHLKRIGKMHCINGTWQEAICWFKKALKVNFLEIIKIVAWCVLELPSILMFGPSKDFKKYYRNKI
ncbi:MAG: glycosyltransferase family 2 protein [Desulfobacterales bacterium]|uniref:Glycosyltransferase family 2 protein n=1 Tax=Candidatus Desulfatibia vada TaxID=2841696 RepID=A0A8J6TUG3_9BACT|nr:glycosyltransferase family 2 protein [Candidatus Desulfatibia vada]